MKKFLLVVLFLVSSIAQAEDCVSFFKGRSTHSGEVYEPASYPCTLHTATGLPGTVGNANVSLYHFADSWTDRVEDLKILALTTEAVHDSLPKLQTLGSVPKNIKILFTNDYASDTRWGDAGVDGETCHIRLFYGIGGNNPKVVKSVIAHELHHCHLLYTFFWKKDSRKTFHTWMVEGLADSFMNYVYPDVNYEWETVLEYRLGNPLTSQKTPYSTNIFFQNWSNRGVSLPAAQLMLKPVAYAQTEKEMHEVMNKITGMADSWANFAEYFLLGMILDDSGAKIPVTGPDIDMVETIKAENTLIAYKVKSFGVTTMKLKTPSTGKITFKIDPSYYEHGFRYSVKRQMQNGQYKKVTPAGPATFILDCDAELRDIMVIATSTESEAETFEPVIQIDYEPVDIDFECPCKKTEQPVDQCLLGKWIGDNDIYAHNMDADVIGFEDVQANGLFTMNIDADKSGASVAKDLHAWGILSAAGFDLKYSQTLNYNLDFTVSQQAAGKICIDPRSFVGMAKIQFNNEPAETVDLASVMYGIPGNMDITEVNYACRGKTLTLYYKDPSRNSYFEWVYHR